MSTITVIDKIKHLFNFIGDLYAMRPQYKLEPNENKLPFVYYLQQDALNQLSPKHYTWTPTNADNKNTDNDVIFSLIKPNLPWVPANLQTYIQIKDKKVVYLTEDIPAKDTNEIAEFTKQIERIKNTQVLFDSFYNKVYLKLENDASYELLLGRVFLHGTVTIGQTVTNVNYPLLLQEISFKDLGDNQKIIATDKQEQTFALTFRHKDTERNDLLLKNLELYNEHIAALSTDILQTDIAKQYQEAIQNKIGSNENINLNVDDGSNWVLLLRKKQIDYQAIAKTLAAHIENFPDDTSISPALKTILGAGQSLHVSIPEDSDSLNRLATSSGYCEEVLFPIPTKANKAQVDIAKKLDMQETAGIVLQGPPGTGKTQTIANITGHLMAQGKRILITSATNKALTVLKDKLPRELQNYCVTDLSTDSSSTDLLSSAIHTITQDKEYYDDENNRKHTEQEIHFKHEKRKELLKQAKKIRQNIENIRKQLLDSFCPISLEGKGYNLKEIASYISAHPELNGLIPGNVKTGNTGLDLPLTQQEINTLYQINRQLTVDDEFAFYHKVPNNQELADATRMEQLWKNLDNAAVEETTLKTALQNIVHELWDTSRQPWTLKNSNINHRKQLIDFARDLKQTIEKLPLPVYTNRTEEYLQKLQQNMEVWKAKQEQWHKNVITAEQISDYEQLLRKIEEIIPEYTDKIIIYTSPKISKAKLYKIQKTLKKPGTMPWYHLGYHVWYNFSAKKCLQSIKINGAPLEDPNDIAWVFKDLKRKEIYSKIQRLSKSLNIKIEDSLPAVRSIKTDLTESLGLRTCYREHLSLTPSYCNFYLSPELLQSILDSDGKDFYWKLVLFVFQCQILFIKLAKNLANKNSCMQEIENTRQKLAARKEIPLCKNLEEAIHNKDLKTYKNLFEQLVLLNNKKESFIQQTTLLNRLASIAPGWAEAIRKRTAPHHKDSFPNAAQAWKYKQFQTIRQTYNALDLDELYKELNRVNEEFARLTVSLVADRTRLQNAIRIIQENNPQTIEALLKLPGFKRRLAQGKGKRSEETRRQLSVLRTQCSSAVPVWIMHIDTALKQMDLKNTVFDLIIIDEASQAELNALLLLNMAKKILIVGDENQTTPSSRNDRLSSEQLNSLKREYKIKEIFGQQERFDRTYSIYEIAHDYGLLPLRLTEHFRCAPDIIEFCNKNFYSGLIKPLRNTSTVKRTPAVIARYIAGATYENGTNTEEAKEIVSLIAACSEQKEYENATFGVIALHDGHQAKLINELLLDKLKDKCIKHKILCGTPAEFQGDERDVIFLSLGYTQESVKRRIDFIGDNNRYAKSYNVAISRARDQIWLIHSIQAGVLASDDCRRILIDYFNRNSHTFDKTNLKELLQQCDPRSPFEKEICEMLFKQGYQDILPQYKVGGYVIDFVVKDDKHSIALECDGDKWHMGTDKVIADMERQEILERSGWKFIRIAGHRFYADKEGAIQDVVRQLQQNNIHTVRTTKEEISNLENRIFTIAQKFKTEYFN